MDFKKIVPTKPLSRLLVVTLLIGVLLIPSAVSALQYGPFQAFGGQVLFNLELIGLPKVLAIKEKLDGSTSLVSPGALIGFCFPGEWVIGFGVKAGPLIGTIFGICTPIKNLN